MRDWMWTFLVGATLMSFSAFAEHKQGLKRARPQLPFKSCNLPPTKLASSRCPAATGKCEAFAPDGTKLEVTFSCIETDKNELFRRACRDNVDPDTLTGVRCYSLY